MSAQQYRKKPVVIEAMRWVPDMPDSYLQSIFGWLKDGSAPWALAHNARSIQINTLEGVMRVYDGDWIIKGVQGEFYPCRPDIFDATYEPVSPRGDETFFAIRRTDGGQIMGEFTWMGCDGLHDWTVAEDAWRDGDDVEFEIVRMTVESLATRTPPDLHTKADSECEYCGEVWPCEWVREHGVDA